MAGRRVGGCRGCGRRFEHASAASTGDWRGGRSRRGRAISACSGSWRFAAGALAVLCRAIPAQAPAWAPYDFSWSEFLALALAGAWYVRGVLRMTPAERPSAPRQLAFGLGLGLIYAVLQTPFRLHGAAHVLPEPDAASGDASSRPVPDRAGLAGAGARSRHAGAVAPPARPSGRAARGAAAAAAGGRRGAVRGRHRPLAHPRRQFPRHDRPAALCDHELVDGGRRRVLLVVHPRPAQLARRPAAPSPSACSPRSR